MFPEKKPPMGFGWKTRADDEVIMEAFAWTGPQDLWRHLPGQSPESGTPSAVHHVSSVSGAPNPGIMSTG